VTELPEIQHRESDTRGIYFMRLASGEKAEMTYTRVGPELAIIDHTGVPPAYRGKGAGLALVARAVADFRAAGTKVMPLCPFAAAQFRKHPDWADVLKG
jgi:predicted GNAT family acetyltransferase